MPLGSIRQEDFSAGEQRDVAPHLIDPRGVYAVLNSLLNDDGSIYKRGGSEPLSTGTIGVTGRYVWDGWLQPGRRTFWASAAAFGTLAEDGKTPIASGGSGYTVPLPARAIQDLLFVGGGFIFGGSLKAADYSTGAVKVVNGSSTVVGAGTKWLTNVDAGMLFRLPGENRVYVVAAVTSDTQLTIRDNYEGASAEGQAYTLKRLEIASNPYRQADLYAVAGLRLIVAKGNTLEFSEPNKPHVYQAKIAPLETVVANKHEIEEGANVIAVESLGVDQALVFHTRGVTSISNFSQPIVDALGGPQHRIDKLSADLIAWGPAGITGYRNSLIVPGMDNVYVMDGTSSPQPLSHSINKVYQHYVQEGFSPGGAWTYRDHYFLPILDAAGTPQDLLCCRVDRPINSRGQVLFPWTSHSGSGAKVAAGAVRSTSKPGDVPAVFGACDDGKLINLATYFTPSGAVRFDHDNTTPLWSMTTRDLPAGELAIGRFRRFRLLYELEDSNEVRLIEEELASPDVVKEESEKDLTPEEEEALKEKEEAERPLILLEVGTGIRRELGAKWDEVDWDDFVWAASDEETQFEQLETGSPPNAGAQSALAQNAWVWPLKTRARYARFRLQSSAPVAKLTIRSIEVFVAQTGGVRQAKVVDA